MKKIVSFFRGMVAKRRAQRINALVDRGDIPGALKLMRSYGMLNDYSRR